MDLAMDYQPTTMAVMSKWTAQVMGCHSGALDYSAGSHAMPSVAVQTFTDPCEYETFTCDAQHRVVIAGRGSYQARTVRMDLQRILMRRAWQSLPSVSHLAIPTGRSAVCFPLDADQISAMWRGREVLPGEMFVVHSGGDFHNRTDEGGQWASVSMASETLDTYMRDVAGSDLKLADVTHVRSSGAAMARLLAVHQAAAGLAETAPDILLRPEVAKAFEGKVMAAVVDCLAGAVMLERHRSTRQPIMRRFEELLEADQDRILHIPDVCSAIGVSERTLRHRCIEHLGMSPYRYLQLRRMHQVRRALSIADAKAKTVTEIATDYGYWELGRFSVAYKRLFGESPSTTLGRETGSNAAAPR
jgi:AraC-like DNA-binding protein